MKIKSIATIAACIALIGCGEDLGGAPDVKGLNLPDAKVRLKQAGFSTTVTSDGLFGVIIEENFTVCEQDTPNGKLVPLEVAKHGC